MTCRELPCHLCDPLSDFSAQWQREGKELGTKEYQFALDRLCRYFKPMYEGEGNLTYEINHPESHSRTPKVRLCKGCLARVLGKTEVKT